MYWYPPWLILKTGQPCLIPILQMGKSNSYCRVYQILVGRCRPQSLRDRVNYTINPNTLHHGGNQNIAGISIYQLEWFSVMVLMIGFIKVFMPSSRSEASLPDQRRLVREKYLCSDISWAITVVLGLDFYIVSDIISSMLHAGSESN